MELWRRETLVQKLVGAYARARRSPEEAAVLSEEKATLRAETTQSTLLSDAMRWNRREGEGGQAGWEGEEEEEAVSYTHLRAHETEADL
eukprot:3784630-Rhodomonas_salina.1